MKRLIGATVVITIAAITISSAQNIDNPKYPPGVSAENWISMGASAGFVVTSDGFQGSDRSTGSLRGYFLVRRGGSWFRADTSGP